MFEIIIVIERSWHADALTRPSFDELCEALIDICFKSTKKKKKKHLFIFIFLTFF